MALEFGFYDSYDHDRMYSAENMNDIFEGVITDGVYAGVGNTFAVRPGTGLQVLIDTGRAWFKSTWNKNRVLTPVNLDPPDPVYDRIDTVCIRVQKSILERRNDFFVYKGSILTTPQPPVITETSDTFYLPLADVTIRARAEEITISDIKILVGMNRCPFVTSILQQTDIGPLFANWEGQFMKWWDDMRETLSSLDQDGISGILAGLENKLDKTTDKAGSADLTSGSDTKWMSPKMTKQMIDNSVGDIGSIIENGVVKSFKGRKGDVVPQSGDYTASDVGALPIDGGTVTGSLGVEGDTTLTGSLNVASSSTFKNGITIQNGSSTYGGTINFYDTNVQIKESSSNVLELKANSIKMSTTAATNPLTLNGSRVLAWNATKIADYSIDLKHRSKSTYVVGDSDYIPLPTNTSWLLITFNPKNSFPIWNNIYQASITYTIVPFAEFSAIHNGEDFWINIFEGSNMVTNENKGSFEWAHFYGGLNWSKPDKSISLNFGVCQYSNDPNESNEEKVATKEFTIEGTVYKLG